MTYKQIEEVRELRLWIGQVIVPALRLRLHYFIGQNASNKIEKLKWKTQIQEQG